MPKYSNNSLINNATIISFLNWFNKSLWLEPPLTFGIFC